MLLAVLGIDPPPGVRLDVRALTELVAYAPDNPGSIVSSVGAARENARGAREVVSSAMWQCLNATYNALPARQRYARLVGPHEFLSYVEDRAAMFAGLADSTMSRDDGWWFLVLGRSVERVDMTVRMVLSRVADRASSPGWLTVLGACGAQDAYLRTYGGVLDAARVAQFLLLDRTFPRSVFASLRQAESCLTELDQEPERRVGAGSEALRLVGRARSELEFLRPADLLDNLPRSLATLQQVGREVGEAVAVQYFHATPWVAWSPEPV
jgi:uncharacterized alpha-E superfamily protein